MRVADGRTWLVPLASAIAQDDVVHLAYARDEVEAVPVVAAGDRLSEDDLTRLYLHYGLGRRATATGEHGVHARRWDWERGDIVGGLEESREVQPGQRAGRQSAQVKAGGFTADVGDVNHRTVEELGGVAPGTEGPTDRDGAQGPDGTAERDVAQGADGAPRSDLPPQDAAPPGPAAPGDGALSPGADQPAAGARPDAVPAPALGGPTGANVPEQTPGGTLPETGGGALGILGAALVMAGGAAVRAGSRRRG